MSIGTTMAGPGPTTASHQRGYTLVELVTVIVILALLSAFAIPRFLNLGANARIAAIKSLAGTLDAAAYATRGLCMANGASGCSAASSAWQGTINGTYYWLNYGWPDAGDALQNGQIDAMIDYSGFRAYLVSNAQTRFVRDDAPSPDNCSVTYYDAYYTPPKYHYVIDTTGC